MKRVILLIVIAFPILLHAQSASVEIWIRAFIPNPENAAGGAGFIFKMPDGGNGSYISLHNIDGAIPNYCFVTDNRGFSDNPKHTSRLETRFRISLSASGTGTVTPGQNRTTAAITSRLDCATGKVLEQKMGSVDLDVVGHPAVAEGTVQVIGQVQGRNLLTPLGGNGPSIDYNFDLQWQPALSLLTASFTYGSFPAFEVYARQPLGEWLPVIKALPSGTPWSLGADAFGINSVKQTVSVNVAGISGRWQSPLPEQRFTFDFNGKKVKLTERNAAGATLTKELDVSEQGEGEYRVDRNNDVDVLTFLGFQPSLRKEILDRGPRPSFFVIKNTDGIISVDFSGLLVTKDAKAHLQNLIQPGDRPAKNFVLSKTL